MYPTPLVLLAPLFSTGAPTAEPFAPLSPFASQPSTTVEPIDYARYSLGAINAATAAPLEDEVGWQFSYTFIEVGATRADLEDIDDEADTYYGTASLDLFDLVYIFLGYENSSTDFNNTDTDYWTLGAGVHFNVAQRLDLLADLAFVYSDLSSDTVSDTSNGHQLRAGARWLPFEFNQGGLELAARGIWVDYGSEYFSDDGQLGFDVEARLHFLRRLSVGLGYRMLEDYDTGSVNARFSF